MKSETLRRLNIAAVWAARLAAGAVFIISGWAKAIDPWGFVLKTGEYLAAWGIDYVPHEAIVAGCVSLACVEFVTGVLLAAGCLRHATPLVATAMMAGMLPLTVYIYLYNPVDDCGCFGDFLKLSNAATMWKNVVLTALVVFLLVKNAGVKGLYPAPSQWLVITASTTLPLLMAITGYRLQPLVDFRPYHTGTRIFAPAEGGDTELLLYERDGELRRFGLDELPDSTWTFVEEEQTAVGDFDSGIAIFNAAGEEVSDEVVNDEGRQLWLVVSTVEPKRLTYEHLVNELNTVCQKEGIEFMAVLGSTGDTFDEWCEWRRPDYPVFTADATSLQQLVRGPKALVFTHNGVIEWKISLQSFDKALLDTPGAIESLESPDSGRLHLMMIGVYLAVMIAILIPAKAIRLSPQNKEKNTDK